MMTTTLPPNLEAVLAYPNPERVFANILPALGDVLQADRCFLYLRNPHTRFHNIICWRRNQEIPNISTVGWEKEKKWEKEDPMFAAALRCEESIFVEDVETASPEQLNLEFEQKYLQHRALIHAHLCLEGLLWGILQPSIFGHCRIWSDFDRSIILQITQKLTPIVVRYVNTVDFQTYLT